MADRIQKYDVRWRRRSRSGAFSEHIRRGVAAYSARDAVEQVEIEVRGIEKWLEGDRLVDCFDRVLWVGPAEPEPPPPPGPTPPPPPPPGTPRG